MIYFWKMEPQDQDILIQKFAGFKFMGFKPCYYSNVTEEMLDVAIPVVTESYYKRMRVMRKGHVSSLTYFTFFTSYYTTSYQL